MGISGMIIILVAAILLIIVLTICDSFCYRGSSSAIVEHGSGLTG